MVPMEKRQMLGRACLPPLLGGLLIAGTVPALAQAPGTGTPPTPNITVVGTGKASATPDLARLQLTILRNAPEAADALAQSNEAADAVIRALREEFGIEGRDIQTAGFQIAPQYRYDNREDGTQAPPTVVGYEVRHSLAARVRDLARIGEILDRTVSLGVNEGGSVEFTVEDPAELADQARIEAVRNARRSAEAMAEASDLRLGRVLRIEDRDGEAPPMPVPMAEMRLAAPAGGGGSVPLELGETTLSSDARVTFELLGRD